MRMEEIKQSRINLVNKLSIANEGSVGLLRLSIDILAEIRETIRPTDEVEPLTEAINILFSYLNKKEAQLSFDEQIFQDIAIALRVYGDPALEEDEVEKIMMPRTTFNNDDEEYWYVVSLTGLAFQNYYINDDDRTNNVFKATKFTEEDGKELVLRLRNLFPGAQLWVVRKFYEIDPVYQSGGRR